MLEPLSAPERAEMQQIWNANPILQMMGVQVDLSEAGCLRAGIDPVQPAHRGGLGSDAVNGVVLSAICDMLVGLTGILYSQKHRTGTVQLNIHFLRPLRGDRLTAVARPTKVGRALVYCHAEILDQTGVVCVSCEGIASVDTSKPPLDNYLAI